MNPEVKTRNEARRIMQVINAHDGRSNKLEFTFNGHPLEIKFLTPALLALCYGSSGITRQFINQPLPNSRNADQPIWHLLDDQPEKGEPLRLINALCIMTP